MRRKYTVQVGKLAFNADDGKVEILPQDSEVLYSIRPIRQVMAQIRSWAAAQNLVVRKVHIERAR